MESRSLTNLKSTEASKSITGMEYACVKQMYIQTLTEMLTDKQKFGHSTCISNNQSTSITFIIVPHITDTTNKEKYDWSREVMWSGDKSSCLMPRYILWSYLTASICV